jgi:hypothetical protein
VTQPEGLGKPDMRRRSLKSDGVESAGQAAHPLLLFAIVGAWIVRMATATEACCGGRRTSRGNQVAGLRSRGWREGAFQTIPGRRTGDWAKRSWRVELLRRVACSGVRGQAGGATIWRGGRKVRRNK